MAEQYEWPEYDSDDMSAGARLMRYYVCDDPRSDNKLPDKAQPRRTASAPEVQHNAPQMHPEQAVRRASARPAGDPDDEEYMLETEPSHAGRFADDDATFRGDLDQLRGDVLYDIAGRHSHREILSKVAQSHPQVQFGSRDLTWRMANALKTRANKLGVSRQMVRQALDESRNANGVEFMHGHYAADKKSKTARRVDNEAGAVFRGVAEEA